MSFLDKLEKLMKSRNIKNLHELSKKCKIPYSTLRGFYSKGTENIKLPTLKTLAKYFNCSIDYLADDDVEEIKPYGNNSIDEDLITFEKILKKYQIIETNESLSFKSFSNTIEMIKANKKFIFTSNEIYDNE